MLVNKWGNRRNVVGSMVIFAIGMIIAPFAHLAPDDYWTQV